MSRWRGVPVPLLVPPSHLHGDTVLGTCCEHYVCLRRSQGAEITEIPKSPKSKSPPPQLTFFITGWACLPHVSKKTHSSCNTELHAAWNLYVRPSSTALPREQEVRVMVTPAGPKWEVNGCHHDLQITNWPVRVGPQERPRRTSIYEVLTLLPVLRV